MSINCQLENKVVDFTKNKSMPRQNVTYTYYIAYIYYLIQIVNTSYNIKILTLIRLKSHNLITYNLFALIAVRI